MPAQIAHILHGNQALKALPAAWSSRFSEPAFHLGCQGPDVFYHSRRTKPGAFLYGTRLHRRGWGAFLARFRFHALSRGWGPEHPGMAFLAGQAAHGFLDRQCHPFVVSFAGWRIPGDPSTEVLRHSHAFLERILDVLLWKAHSPQALSSCLWQEGLPGPEGFPSDFWTAWAEALHEVLPKISSREDVEVRLRNAVADTRGFLAATAPSAEHNAVRAARQGALHWFHPRALPDWDFLNLSHAPWPDPVTGLPRTESAVDLFDRAVGEAQGALAALPDPGADWEALLGNESLNLPGLDEDHPGPVHSRPWDYAALYDREVQARLAPESLP